MFNLMKKRYFWLIFLIILISFVLIKVSSSERQDITMAENFIREIYTPLFSGVSGVKQKFTEFGMFFEDRRKLNETIAELRQENKRLKLENQALLEYKSEALRLKKALEFKNSNLEIYTLTAARVIGRSPSNWHQIIIIDKGEDDGIKKDMPVITPDGLVGVVTSTSKNSSYVSLLTDRSVAIGALIQETRETNGIVEGTGDSNILRMTNIPYYSVIKENDNIITSGLSLIYPKGIRIGKVAKVYSEPGGLLLSADIEPAVNFDKLEEVLIITDFRPLPEGVTEEKEQ